MSTHPLQRLSALAVAGVLAAGWSAAGLAQDDAEPGPDDPRRGVPTTDWRESQEVDTMTRDRLIPPGLWRAWLDLPSGHELSFTLDVDFRRDHFRDPIYGINLLNGTDDAIPATITPIEDAADRQAGEDERLRDFAPDRFEITFAGSSARVEATVNEGRLKVVGEYIYERQTDAGPIEFRVPFSAINSDGRRFDTPEPDALEPMPELPEDWAVTFESLEGPAVMTLRVLPDGRHVQGTIATPTGDDGVLFGVFHDGRLRMSRFTGTSGLLYDATLQPDGSLIGTFHSLAHHSETFTATPTKDAALPDLFEQTRWLDGVSPAELAFRDTTGAATTVGDIAPGPSLLYIFGTWCHNCTDATHYLNELHAVYGDQLSMVGIAFESPDTFEDQAERVRRYRESRGVEFPLLVAGQRDKSAATETLGALDRLRAYPTFVFVDEDGEVAAVHQGFIGPADPDRHAALRSSFDAVIEDLLAGS
ncbi:MAG: TlpA disulfide reductase family protein [Planctomycetota bacterium]